MNQYSDYKDSGIEWIGMIPSTWKVSRFNHNFSFSRGLPITKQDLKDNGIPCVSYGEIHSKFGRIVDPEMHQLKFVDESFLESNSNSLLFRGDFLFADTSEDVEGSGNFTCLDSDIPTFAGYHTVIARLFNSHEFDYKYLSYFFDSIEFRNQIRSSVSGIKVFSITQGILKSTSLIIPPPKDQVAIASYLDRKTAEIDELIADKKCLLDLYEEEKSAVINQAVTKGINPNAPMKDSGIEWLGEIPEHWEVKRLKYIIRGFESGVSVNSLDNPIISDEYGILKTSCVYDYTFRPEENKVILNQFELERARTNPKKGMIIISRMNTPDLVGASGYVDKDYPNLFLPDRLWQTVFHPDIMIDSKWLSFVLKSMNFRKLLSTLATGTSPSMKNIGQEDVLNIPIPYSETQEQQTIVRHIETECAQINWKIADTKKLIDLLTEYRTALISEVVTGKTKVVD
jgi:type I restriction enzyme S subunit